MVNSEPDSQVAVKQEPPEHVQKWVEEVLRPTYQEHKALMAKQAARYRQFKIDPFVKFGAAAIASMLCQWAVIHWFGYGPALVSGVFTAFGLYRFWSRL